MSEPFSPPNDILDEAGNPVRVGPAALVDDHARYVDASGTRKYGDGGRGERINIAAAATQSAPIAAREVLLHASSACYVRAEETVPSTDVTTGCIPLTAGEKFHMQINVGETIVCIRDSANGFLSIIPVA